MKNTSGQVIYVGKAKNLRKRVKQYFTDNEKKRAQIPLLLKELSTIDTLIVPSEKEALLLENTLIKKHSPKFNILLKDDKDYISLSLDPAEPWPRLQWARLKARPKKGILYFGPYTSGKAARQIFDLMTNLFPLRQCSNEEFKRRERPCLLYGIKKCLAPCVGLCSEDLYQKEVKKAVLFLQGESKDVCQQLEKKMWQASENLEFEQAGALLELIRQVQEITKASSSLSCNLSYPDTDVLGLYWEDEKTQLIRLLFRQGRLVGSEPFFFESTIETNEELVSLFLLQNYIPGKFLPKEIILPFAASNFLEEALQEKLETKISLCHPIKGKKKELLALAEENAKAAFLQKHKEQASIEEVLTSLQEKLSLSKYPKHIECFDTSNLAGEDPVASMVTFIDGKEEKGKNRVYHLKGLDRPDDYAALKQALERRLQKAREENILPDLLLIDGGKGQLGVALRVIEALDIVNVDVVSLVKEEARHDKGLTLEKVWTTKAKEPISFPMRAKELFFLQRVRDAAHQKAISFHRKTKRKKALFTALQNVPGIGPIKQKKILSHFGSLANILSSDVNALEKPVGFSKKDIEKIQEHFKKNIAF